METAVSSAPVADTGSSVTPETSSEASGTDIQSEVTQETGQPKVEAKNPTEKQLRKLADQDMDAIVTVKVNGKAKDMSVREALRVKQLEEASYEKMNEAAQMKKQLSSLAQMAKSDPKKFFQAVGIDPYEFAESTLAEKLELLSMSPEKREAMEYKQQLERYKEQEAEQKRQSEEQKRSQEEKTAMASLDQEISTAFKESGLPKHALYVQQIAAEMLGAAKRGEDLPAKEAAARVKERFTNQVREIFDTLDAQAIQGYLSEGAMKKLREFEVQRVTEKTAPTPNSAQVGPGKTSTPKAENKTPKKPMSEKEWRNWVASHKT